AGVPRGARTAPGHHSQPYRSTATHTKGTTMSKFSKHDDVINSHEVIERIEELREELDETPTPASKDEPYAELRALEKLDSDGRPASEDWEYGETLVNEDYFVTYGQEFAEEIGA